MAEQPSGKGMIAYSYTGGSDTAIHAHGRAYATGGWYTGGLIDYKGAPCVISPELGIIAAGTVQLKNGRAEIDFPAIFKENIRSDIPVRINLTPRGDPNGILCVSGTKINSFEVNLKQIPGWKGDNGIYFDWMAFGTLKEPEISAEEKAELNRLIAERGRQERKIFNHE